MKKFKKLLLPLALASLIGLSACSLFNDDDIAIHNSFNPKISTPSVNPDAVYARGVEGKVIDKTPNALCFKNISYATNDRIANTYKTGGANENEFNVNNGEDYSATKSSNNYDLYVPNALKKNEKHTVILFIHGGAWISGFKTDVNSYVHEFANKGYITATIKYTLLKQSMDDSSLSIFRNLDEIDACIKSIKSALDDLDFDTSKSNLVIGGASSGAHLAMLYSYSRGYNSPIPISFVVDAVGPVDIKPANWKSFAVGGEEYNTALNNGLSYSAIEAERAAGHLGNLRVADPSGDSYDWNEYQTMRIANGMCGIPFSIADIESTTDESKAEIITPNAASNAMTKNGGGEDQLSVTYWMNNTPNRFPIICGYAGQDGVVGIAQYATLENTLDNLSITHEYFYFKERGHTDIDKDETVYEQFVNKISDWCEAI